MVMPQSKVFKHVDVLDRLMTVILGPEPCYFVTDESHLSDFAFDEEDRIAVADEFGKWLPNTSMYLWEAVEFLV